MRKKSSTVADIAGRLKSRRLSVGISLRKCAGLLGINTGTLAAIEDGRTASPSIHHLTKIASFLHLSLDELLKAEDWACAPRGLHDVALELGLSYKEVCSLNLLPLREAADSKAEWELLVRILRQQPNLLPLIEEHPQTLDTVARQFLGIPRR